MAVDAVVYYRISNATIAITNVEDYGHSTRLLAATTLRNVLGTKNLSEILSERESISHVMQVSGFGFFFVASRKMRGFLSANEGQPWVWVEVDGAM